ncbi:unnamed protein product [Brassica oleracea var. botrytis]
MLLNRSVDSQSTGRIPTGKSVHRNFRCVPFITAEAKTKTSLPLKLLPT